MAALHQQSSARPPQPQRLHTGIKTTSQTGSSPPVCRLRSKISRISDRRSTTDTRAWKPTTKLTENNTGLTPRLSWGRADVAFRGVRVLAMVGVASLTLSCHTAASPPDAQPATTSTHSAFVYTTRSQAVGVTDSLQTRVLYTGDIGTGGSNFLTEDSRYLVLRSSVGSVSAVDVATGSAMNVDCACESAEPKPGEGNAIYWLAADGSVTRLTLGVAGSKPEIALRLVLPDPPVDPGRQTVANLDFSS